MPSHTAPDGRSCPDAEDVNARIRHLMRQPASAQRAAEYARLLALWGDLTRDDDEQAA